jgi:hypothetical protein
MLDLLLAAAAFAPQGPGTSTASIVINEFLYDDGGTDDWEFVELFNRGPVAVDISGWTILNNDAASPGYGGSGAGGVPTHVVLPGVILQPGTYYLIGNANIVPAPIAGVSQVMAGNGLENGAYDTIELYDGDPTLPTTMMVDAIIYEVGGGTQPLPPWTLEGKGIYGDLGCGNGPLSFASAQRVIDGWDDDKNETDFRMGFPTPGAMNLPTGQIPYIETFDLGTSGGIIPGWNPGWVNAKYVDPTVIDAQNRTQKPASPQGGLAMSMWDSTGGGNSVYLDMPPVQDVVIETYAYFEPPMQPVNPAPYSPTLPTVLLDNYNIGDGEWWAVGARGTVAPNGNPPDVGGYFATVSLGVGIRYHWLTGICWAHFRTPTSSQLYLLDCTGAGTADPFGYTVLAGPIDIIPNATDGWQRIRLHLQGNTVVANFGGTYGADDGARFVANTTTTTLGTVYATYREALLFNSNGTAGCHPPLFDLFDVHQPTTSVTTIGSPSPTTVGTPTIFSEGFPILGTTGWKVGATGMVPQGAPNYSFCGVVFGFSSFPFGYPLPGTPPTALAYVLPILSSAVGFADATGTVSWTLPLPYDPSLTGLSIVSQVVDFDPFLGFPAPIGTSQAMDAVIGN